MRFSPIRSQDCVGDFLLTQNIRSDRINKKKTMIERMLILLQDQVAAEAAASAVVHSVAVLAVAVDSAADPMAVLTVAASEGHTTVVHLVGRTEVILAVIIMLPHPRIITITARFSGVQEDVQSFTVVAVASV
jgi:hypothetical protein